MLENGFLSIHSCAITWEAVLKVHFKALSDSMNHQTDYLIALANGADTIKSKMDEIYGSDNAC